MGMVNGHVTSFPSIFSFLHKMTCDELVKNGFIGDSDRNVMEYRKLNPEYLAHVKRE